MKKNLKALIGVFLLIIATASAADNLQVSGRSDPNNNVCGTGIQCPLGPESQVYFLKTIVTKPLNVPTWYSLSGNLKWNLDYGMNSQAINEFFDLAAQAKAEEIIVDLSGSQASAERLLNAIGKPAGIQITYTQSPPQIIFKRKSITAIFNFLSKDDVRAYLQNTMLDGKPLPEVLPVNYINGGANIVGTKQAGQDTMPVQLQIQLWPKNSQKKYNTLLEPYDYSEVLGAAVEVKQWVTDANIRQHITRGPFGILGTLLEIDFGKNNVFTKDGKESVIDDIKSRSYALYGPFDNWQKTIPASLVNDKLIIDFETSPEVVYAFQIVTDKEETLGLQADKNHQRFVHTVEHNGTTAPWLVVERKRTSVDHYISDTVPMKNITTQLEERRQKEKEAIAKQGGQGPSPQLLAQMEEERIQQEAAQQNLFEQQTTYTIVEQEIPYDELHEEGGEVEAAFLSLPDEQKLERIRELYIKAREYSKKIHELKEKLKTQGKLVKYGELIPPYLYHWLKADVHKKVKVWPARRFVSETKGYRQNINEIRKQIYQLVKTIKNPGIKRDALHLLKKIPRAGNTFIPTPEDLCKYNTFKELDEICDHVPQPLLFEILDKFLDVEQAI